MTCTVPRWCCYSVVRDRARRAFEARLQARITAADALLERRWKRRQANTAALRQEGATIRLQLWWLEILNQRRIAAAQEALRLQCAVKIQKAARGRAARSFARRLQRDAAKILAQRHTAAARIQAVVRGRQCRRLRLIPRRLRAWRIARGPMPRPPVSRVARIRFSVAFKNRTNAVVRIQGAFRRFRCGS